jgi:hypothetical protein
MDKDGQQECVFCAHLFVVVRAETFRAASWTQQIHVASDRFQSYRVSRATIA